MKSPEVQDNVSVSQGVRMMFYMMTPSETTFQTLEVVPDYVKKATPFFISLILLELIISWILKGKPPGRLDDILTSMSAGVVSRLPSFYPGPCWKLFCSSHISTDISLNLRYFSMKCYIIINFYITTNLSYFCLMSIPLVPKYVNHRDRD
ncbi:Agmo [Phodopus roborovskii]|uniref:Agmo protein n=1 Tax=Phodopus roborovskii TaxID=109678 RepID=A0AAU9YTU4_PHORO|nr:Agmo [Phodopus roborovskii]